MIFQETLESSIKAIKIKLSYALVLPFCSMSGRGNRAKIHYRAVLLSLNLRTQRIYLIQDEKNLHFSLGTSVKR